MEAYRPVNTPVPRNPNCQVEACSPAHCKRSTHRIDHETSCTDAITQAMRALLLLLAAAASAEWVEWPPDQAVPEGASQRINVNTNKVEVDIDVNATLLEHRYRTSVNEATRAEDTTANLTRRETMVSALKRLPEEEVGDVDALTDDELDALWSDRQESLRKWSEQLSDAAQSLQNRLAALLRDDEKAKLEALDELCATVSEACRVDGVEAGAVTMSRRWRGGGSKSWCRVDGVERRAWGAERRRKHRNTQGLRARRPRQRPGLPRRFGWMAGARGPPLGGLF